MYGYKIVDTATKNLLSFTMGIGEGLVKYKKRRWTKPKRGCGPLCVFGELKDCMRHKDLDSEIYYIKYKKADGEFVWNKYRRMHVDYILPGTVLAKKVKLLRKVS